MTQYAINVDGEGIPYGGEWGGTYNPYMYNLLEASGYDNLTITDWGVFQFSAIWGVEELEEADRIATSWERGANLLGGYGTVENAVAAYDILVERNGQEGADEIMQQCRFQIYQHYDESGNV